MTKYFVDAQGKYIGAFDGVDPPAGAIEIPAPPDFAVDVYDAIGGTWDTSKRPTAIQSRPKKMALIKILQKLQNKFPAEAAEYQPYIDALNAEA